MERKLQERMIGAGVLVLALVLVAPVLLDGTPRGTVEEADVPGQRSDEIRSHTFRIDSPGGTSRPGAAPSASANAPAVAPSAATPSPAALSMADRTAPADRPTTVRDDAPVPAPADATATAPVAATAAVPAATSGGAPPAKAPAPPRPAIPPVGASRPPATPAPAPAAKGGWVVQVGTFGQKANAERLVATLERKGFAAFLSPTSRSGSTLYRVRVGPAGTKPEAQAVAGRLAAAGQAGQVVAQ